MQFQIMNSMLFVNLLSAVRASWNIRLAIAFIITIRRETGVSVLQLSILEPRMQL